MYINMDKKTQYAMMFDSMMEANAGYFRISEVISAGIDRIHAYEWLATRVDIEKVAKGLYVRKSIVRDPFYILSYGHKNIIFSHRSALYLNKMTDNPILKPDVTVRAKYNVSVINKSCNVFQVDEKYLHVGKITVPSPSGHMVNTYNPERTLCDIVRKKTKMGANTLRDTVLSYFSTENRDTKLLFEYAELFGIKDRILAYCEVLS